MFNIIGVNQKNFDSIKILFVCSQFSGTYLSKFLADYFEHIYYFIIDVYNYGVGVQKIDEASTVSTGISTICRFIAKNITKSPTLPHTHNKK